jgi:hypothetical protein
MGHIATYFICDIILIETGDIDSLACSKIRRFIGHNRGTRWSSWLGHCTTSRKAAGSIPDGVIGIFHLHNPSGRTMALRSNKPLTEMSTRNISWRVNAAGA